MSTKSRMEAGSFCPLFALFDNGTPLSLKVGATPVATAAGQVDGGGVPLTASRDCGLEVNADTGSVALSGDYYVAAIKGNLVHGTAEPNASMIGVLGMLNNNTAAFGSGDKYAVRGHLDLWGSCSLTGANVNVGAVSAYVENEATTTVDAGNVLCGLQAYQVSNAPTLGVGALNPALWVRSSTGGGAKWQYGIYMLGEAVKQGIKIGVLSSTTAGSGVLVDSTYTSVVEVHGDDGNAARTAGITGRAILGRLMIYADTTQENWGVDGLVKWSGVAHTANVNAGVVGRFESTGTCTMATGSGNTYAAGVMGRVGGGGTFTIGAGTYVSGVLAFYNTSTANAFTGAYTSGFHVATTDIASCGKWDYGLYVEGDAASNGIVLGTSAVPITLATYANKGFQMYTTCAGTDTGNNLEPFYVKNTLTGAGQVGGRARFDMETNVVLGAWANALKAYVDLKTNGHSNGLMSVVCAEMVMPASTPAASGVRAIYEAELVCPASWGGNNITAPFYINVTGATKANFDTFGYLFYLQGVTMASGKFFQANTASAATHALRCRIEGTDYYLMLTTAAA